MTTNVIQLTGTLAEQFEEALDLRNSTFCKETVFLEIIEDHKKLEEELALLFFA